MHLEIKEENVNSGTDAIKMPFMDLNIHKLIIQNFIDADIIHESSYSQLLHICTVHKNMGCLRRSSHTVLVLCILPHHNSINSKRL